MRCGLSTEAFIGTGVVSAVVVDLSRLLVYGSTFLAEHFSALSEGGLASLTMAGMASAFLGSFIGARVLKKTTIRTVQLIVGAMLLLLSLALAAGLL